MGRLAALVLLTVSTSPTSAQGPSTATSPPDWSGFYALATGRSLAGFTPINPNLDQVIIDHLQPWARARMEATDGVAEDTGQICQLSGLFRNPTFAGSFLFVPGRDKIVIIYGAVSTAGIQRVYMNRPHPRNLPLTWNGDSIGRWEGDTLVVDTIGFNDKSWLHPAMQPHTSDVHLIQRIRQVGNGEFIEIVGTVDDRRALTSAYTFSRYYRRTGTAWRENVCNDDLDLWRDYRDKALKPLIERSKEVR